MHYATEYFQSLYPGQAVNRRRKMFAKRLKSLQLSLGELNDIQVHGALADGYASANRSRGAVLKSFAMGLLSGKELAKTQKLLKAVKRDGRKFSACAVFWE